MNSTNKILIILVVILVLVLVGLVFWQKIGIKPSYAAVYLETGDLYFGKLTYFPFFGLRNVYTIQVNQGNQENPLSLQKFSSVFWGPSDYLKINKGKIVWITKLSGTSELLKVLETNPDLAPPPTPPPAGQGQENQEQIEQ